MLGKSAATILLLSTAVLADQSSYSAGGNNYAAPAASASSYSAPSSGAGASYAAPAVGGASGYGAPAGNGYAAATSSGYDAPAGYDVGSYDYGYGVEETGSAEGKLGFSLEEIIPLFLVVFAAIILASILGPLFAQLLMLIVGLLPMALNIKAPIVNAILGPFNLGLCAITTGAAPTIVTGRSFDEWEMDTTYIQAFFDAYNLAMSNMQ